MTSERAKCGKNPAENKQRKEHLNNSEKATDMNRSWIKQGYEVMLWTGTMRILSSRE